MVRPHCGLESAAYDQSPHNGSSKQCQLWNTPPCWTTLAPSATGIPFAFLKGFRETVGEGSISYMTKFPEVPLNMFSRISSLRQIVLLFLSIFWLSLYTNTNGLKILVSFGYRGQFAAPFWMLVWVEKGGIQVNVNKYKINHSGLGLGPLLVRSTRQVCNLQAPELASIDLLP